MRKITLVLSIAIFSLVANATFYVVPGGAGAADGSSWANAYGDIQTAINAASALYVSSSAPQEVWVKAGTYSTSTAAIIMKESVSLYGGFAGSEADKSLRAKGTNVWDYSNVSTLNGGATKRCIEAGAANYTNVTVIDGFTLTNGNGQGAQLTNTGGGALLRANLKLQNCIVTGNTTTGNGGGINAAAGIISNCWIYSNTTTSATIPSAGGIYSAPASTFSTIVDNCLIERNSMGGVRFQGAGTVTMDRCNIRNNTSSANGASIYLNNPTSCTITNCLITNNSGVNNIYLNKGKLINSTIANNEGGVYLASATNVSELYNNIIVNNFVIATSTPTSVSVVSSYPAGNVKNNAVYPEIDAQSWGGATNTLLTTDAATALSQVAFKSATNFIGVSTNGTQLAAISNANWSLSASSLGLNFGNNSLIPGGITKDFIGKNRISNSTVEVGAYEYWDVNVSDSKNSSDLSLELSSDINVLDGGILTVNNNSSVNNLTIASGGKVTLQNTKELTANNLIIESNVVNGTGTFVDEGGTLTATTTTVQQALASGRNWWYLSSPLSNAFTGTVFAGSQVGKYDETNFNYTAPFGTSTKMDAGVGYVIKFPNTNAQALTFTGGTLNTGNTGLTPTRTGTTEGKRGFNLVGNPYPSYLNWDDVYTDPTNPAVNMRNAIWFRTNDGGMTFHTYGDGDGVPEVTSPKIAPMQAFWVKVNADGSSGSLTFKNAHRSHFTAGANPLKVKATDDRQRLRLVVSDGNAQDEMLIVGKTYATNGMDSYDIEKMSNDNAAIPEIYSLINNQEFVINSISPIVENQEIKLGLRPSAAGTFSIRASQIQNIPAGLRVILKDALRNTETELTDGVNYSFAAGTETVDNRFSIQFRTTGAITLLPENNQGDILVFVNPSKQIEILNSADWTPDTRLMLFNAAGQKVTECLPTGNRTIVPTTLRGGIYIVQIQNATQSVQHKVILR